MSSSPTETFQITPAQAEMYESTFVPAIFAQWAPLLLDAAGVAPGQRVLDVACGTGILARTAAERIGPTGSVVGVDLNPAMLTVARRLRPDLDWRQGDVADLPFVDSTFDVVLCQSALMFFPDATRALREMARVCKPGGTVGVQVYSSLHEQPAYGPWVDMVARHAGPDTVSLLSTYWVHGDLDTLTGRFQSAGLEVADIRTALGTARWDSVDQMVQIEVESSPLVDRISDETYRRIREESRDVLGQYQAANGAAVPIASHLVLARKQSLTSTA
jgi:SAM-dependent methyltransferase